MVWVSFVIALSSFAKFVSIFGTFALSCPGISLFFLAASAIFIEFS